MLSLAIDAADSAIVPGPLTKNLVAALRAVVVEILVLIPKEVHIAARGDKGLKFDSGGRCSCKY